MNLKKNAFKKHFHKIYELSADECSFLLRFFKLKGQFELVKKIFKLF